MSNTDVFGPSRTITIYEKFSSTQQKITKNTVFSKMTVVFSLTIRNIPIILYVLQFMNNLV